MHGEHIGRLTHVYDIPATRHSSLPVTNKINATNHIALGGLQRDFDRKLFVLKMKLFQTYVVTMTKDIQIYSLHIFGNKGSFKCMVNILHDSHTSIILPRQDTRPYRLPMR